MELISNAPVWAKSLIGLTLVGLIVYVVYVGFLVSYSRTSEATRLKFKVNFRSKP